ncbi:DnaD domain protein [Exiguobacterium sp. s192]|uniref:DnaD domain protein n=1 Tax=Exiguobacterium sp. s192 TaxID=2751206 RepID=UPI001BE59349|nr:DnaD domain protein [Exiguobacterium sp. s192]
MRIQKKDNYVVIDKTLLNNRELSWKAKGLHSYLMSLPDDWKVQEADLVKRSKDGKESTRSAIKELIEAGYIKRISIREKGKIKSWEFVVYELPTFDVEVADEPKPNEVPNESKPNEPQSENPKVAQPDSGFPDVEKPDVGKPDLENPPLLSNKGTKEPKELKKEVVVDAGAKQDATTELIEFYKQNIEPLAPPFTIEKILDDIESYGVELVRFAVETAILSNVRKYAYIAGILTTWAQAGIKTIEQARHQANEFRERQRTRGGKRTGGLSGMKAPAWLEGEKQKQQEHEAKQKAEAAATVPDDEELNAILQDLKGLEQ